MPVLKRLPRLLRLLPITPPGLLLLLAGLVAMIPFGLWREDRVLLTVGAAAVGLTLCAILFVTVGALLCYRTILAQPQRGVLRLEVGQWGDTGFSVVRPWLVPWLDLTWTVLSPAIEPRVEAVGRRMVERWRAERRGHHDLIHRRFTVRDAFGLASVCFDLREARPQHFSPTRGKLANVQVIQGLSGGDQIGHHEGSPQGDLVDMRSYGPGDPIRFVLWRVYARSRQLLVRTPERALSPVERTLAYLVTSPDDEAAAATAQLAVSTDVLGKDWIFATDGQLEPCRTAHEATQALIRSASHPPDQGGSGLLPFLEGQQDFSARRAVLFVPGTTGPWVDRVLAASEHTRFDIFIGIDRVDRLDRLGWLRRIFFRSSTQDRPGIATDSAALAALCLKLGPAGTVRVVDRGAGILYSPAHVAALIGKAA
ncbi:MAG: DUF58 domain-containing protein [Deltaproteobacteria bacterium]|nr:MAG: DUF58 domain-containing protein [Deltaproteobacteria bacterium]